MGQDQSGLKSLKKANPNGHWKVAEKMGSGSYGTVNKVVNLQTGEAAAAKIVTLQTKDEIHGFEDELRILSRLKHDNITNYIDGYLNRKELWIIIDLCEGGSLADMMDFIGGPLKEDCLKSVAFQASDGLQFLHDSLIMHRDVKAANIMLSANGVIKLGDFGVSALLKSKSQKRSTFIGSPNWMAPEVALCETNPTKKYNFKADIWSLGITMMELAQGVPPFNELHVVKILMTLSAGKVPSLDKPEEHSSELRSFLAFALVSNPDARPTAAALHKHEFCEYSSQRSPLVRLVEAKITADNEAAAMKKRQKSKRLQALAKQHGF